MTNRSRLRLPPMISLGLVALAFSACGEESFESADVCKNMPAYDNTATKPNAGVISPSSPLSGKEQEALAKAAAVGCITLPGSGQSLQPESNTQPAPENNTGGSAADQDAGTN